MSARTSLLRLVGVAALLATSGPACRAILGWDDFTFDGTGGGGTGGTGGTDDDGSRLHPEPDRRRDR